LTNLAPLITPPGTDERTYWANRVWRPWIERIRPLRDSTVLEYGCGPGSVSRALAPHTARYIGLDIDRQAIETAEAMNRSEHATFHAHPPDEIIDALRSYEGQVDVVLLYAVLEHLTIAERLAVLAAARTVARPHGVIVVTELPNRLTPLDHHSSFEPFVSQLPDELALDYLQDAQRPELRDLVLSRREPSTPADEDEEALMALRRFGRAASYHEFEVAWGGRVNDHVMATNWGPEVIPHREVHPGEVALARTLTRLRPDLGPCWSREWIDLILAPDPLSHRDPFHGPWTGLPGPEALLVEYDAINDVMLLPSGEAVLHLTLPEQTRQIAVRVVDGETQTTVHAETSSGDRVEGTGPGHPTHGRSIVLDLPTPSNELLLRVAAGGWIIGVTYLGYGASVSPDELRPA
jgi:SAM-dependent methyltransferase